MVSALKCVHCSSYQGWRGIIPSGSAITSLIGAAIAVLAAIIPTVYHFASTPRSKILISNPSYNNGYVEAFASNNGDRPGLVEYAEFLFQDQYSGRTASVPMAREEDALGKVIAGGESALLMYTFSHDPYDLGRINPIKCRVLFVISNFDGQQELWDKKISCPKVSGIRVANYGLEPEFIKDK